METLIYEYGCRLDAECLPDVSRQFDLAHRLYNDCVAAIRAARDEAEAVLRAAHPDYACACAHVDALDAEFKAAKADNDEEGMKRVRAMEREAWAACRPLRAQAKREAGDKLRQVYGRIGKNSGQELHRLAEAAKCEGLYWNTADETLAAVLQAWDKVKGSGGQVQFRRRSERTQDHISVRFTAAGGVSAGDVLAGYHSLVSLGEPGFRADRPDAKAYPGFRFSLGNKLHARGWWQNHRSFPEGARVTTVRLVRKRIGPDVRWALQFQLAVEEEHVPKINGIPKKRAPLAALHFGWSMSDDGLRRIAATCDSGDAAAAQFIDLPYDIQEDFARAKAVQSRRDTLRDEFVNLALKGDNIAMQGWMEDCIERLHMLRRLPVQHIAPSRLCHLNGMLRDSGTPWADLDTYAREDRLLWQEQRHIERRTRNRRLYFYRHLALDLVRRYETLVVSMPNLAESAKRIKDDGERNELGQMARTARSEAALYELKQALDWAAQRAGTAILWAKGFEHTKPCALCGAPVERVTDLACCHACGASADNKANSAANLFRDWLGRYAQAAEEAKAAIIKAKQDAAEAKKKRLALMQAKRAEVRAKAEKNEGESTRCK
ncbi:MAG: hypothetical protein C3F19_00810 [Rhodocyclales bacterium]|nr:MAG: hypothetical protein C3F19_00810 [Rhodocyclales bacterium]